MWFLRVSSLKVRSLMAVQWRYSHSAGLQWHYWGFYCGPKSQGREFCCILHTERIFTALMVNYTKKSRDLWPWRGKGTWSTRRCSPPSPPWVSLTLRATNPAATERRHSPLPPLHNCRRCSFDHVVRIGGLWRPFPRTTQGSRRPRREESKGGEVGLRSETTWRMCD